MLTSNSLRQRICMGSPREPSSLDFESIRAKKTEQNLEFTLNYVDWTARPVPLNNVLNRFVASRPFGNCASPSELRAFVYFSVSPASPTPALHVPQFPPNFIPNLHTISDVLNSIFFV